MVDIYNKRILGLLIGFTTLLPYVIWRVCTNDDYMDIIDRIDSI